MRRGEGQSAQCPAHGAWRMAHSAQRIAHGAWLLAPALLLFAPPSRADDESGVLANRHHHWESPQNFAFEFRFSPYRPRVDADPSLLGTPYADTFGTMPRLEIAAEFDWQTLRIPHVGTLGPGFSVGYTSMGAPAMKADGTGPSAETTSLDIFPMYAVLVLRVDMVEKDLHVPLVPYVKGGLGLAFWRAYNDGGTSSAPNPAGPGTIAGKGHTVGTHVALGLSLDLNAFDRTAASNFDNSVGVNHTYLFAEAYLSALTGLAQSHALYVGNGSITAPALAFGLAFEF